MSALIGFTENKENFCLRLHYNGANSYLFLNDTKIHKFKARVSEIVETQSCLRNASKDWSVDNMEKTGLTVYFNDFDVDYDAIAVGYILDIYKY